jgi:UDP-2-acetamido-3-amino-2,3-dideoxy-glucuronate N-acetyltransferase
MQIAKGNVCVVGCGHWGKNLVRNVHQLGHLYGVCEANPTQLENLKNQYEGVKTFSSLAEVCADDQIDAVMLATPAEQHFTMGVELLNAGKHLFVEKPLALDWQEGTELVRLAHQRGLVLMVGHLLKYHPAFLKIQELIADPNFGKVEYIYSNRLSMGKIRKEENALWSFAPHDISLILSLMGQRPLQVTATGGAYLQPNIADVTVSNFLFDRGVRAHIFVSWLHPYKEHRLVIIGSRQMIAFTDTRPADKLVVYDKRIELKNGAFEVVQPNATSIPFGNDEPLQRECAHFIDCVRDGRSPHTPGEEGVEVLQVLQACQRSLQMNGEPVQVGTASAQRLLRL